MNMKHRLIPTHLLSTLAVLAPVTTHAQATEELPASLPIEMSIITFLILGALLICSIIMLLKYKSGFTNTSMQLTDITTELEHARHRFTETSQTLEKTEQNLKNTTQRYQDILFNAQIGMFQMDLDGKCTYINTALQKLSGLYPKKALKEGLQSAIHPDDRAHFDQAWKTFIKGNDPFALPFRFKPAKGPDVHVTCLANKVYNAQKKVESYIGWVSNVTDFHKEHLHEQTVTSHYTRFIEETVEGYYHLAPETPIPIAGSADKMAATIMDGMKLVSCNDTFANLYGSSPSSLKGKDMSALQDGCGPFNNKESVKKLIEANYKLIGFESVRQVPRGNRLNLLNNAIGIVEDNKLVGIWGSQRNVSQLKREKEELISQAQFMHRILDALPADVHVKDTRCRYLYASRKLAERTGIPQENWIGKTIFEVMPATPRDHDKNAINVMKTGKLSRVERSYKARKKTGWMETVQVPLVSDEGLIEGMVGLSFETSERKKKEEEELKHRKQLEQQLQARTNELQKSQDEYGKTASTLHSTSQELRIRETELENHKNEFNEQLNERKRVEELLRRNEETLLTHQKQLEDQLSSRLAELESETDKRKKWEELIAIKENELQKLEESANTRSEQLENEIAQRREAEANLKAGKKDLEKYRHELETLGKERKQEVSALIEKQKKELAGEHTARKTAESQLKRTTTALQAAQTRIQTLIEQHATELEHEVAERKTASTKLIQNAEELDDLKQKFNTRIEQETKALKRELAQKQIHEKALRQQEKDLEIRIKELEKTLQTKIQENNLQIQEREGAEVQRQQIEQKLEHMNDRQNQLIERETQKLNLNIAEIRLEEIKLRKEVGDLEQEKEALEDLAKTRAKELDQAVREQEKTAAVLSDTQKKLEELKSDQASLVARETQTLQDELKKLKQTESNLRQQEELLSKQGCDLEKTIKKLSSNLTAETQNREAVEKELHELQVAFDAGQDNLSTLINEQTKDLSDQIKQHKKNEADLKKTETALRKQADALQKTIDTRTSELAEAQKEREKAELELVQVIERSSQGAKEIEAQIAEIKKENLAEIQRVKDEQKEIRTSEKHYRSLFQSSADAFLQINLKSGKIQTANLAAAQLFGEETTKALAGKTMDALSPKRQPENTPSADMAKARLHSALETGHENFEWQFLKADKETFHSLVSLSTIQVEEKELILAVVTDISDIKQRQADLQQIIEEAHAANKMNSKIVDEVTETVQTSLEPVVNSAAVMEKAENLTEEQKLDISGINRNCRTLIDTMHYRRELSHVADGSDEIEPSKCDLHELIKDIDQQFSQRAETKKLFFAVSYAQYQSANNVPKFVETDEKKIRTVLSILLGYALAHTEKGRLGLHAARKSDEKETLSVGFELAYTGKTKQDTLLSQVFASDGTGAEDMQYGLTLAQQYIRMLDGEIELEYRQGDVTALMVNFPFKKVASEIVMPNKDAEAKQGAA
jgi:PAS domain S-box-containing protein